MRCFRRQTIFPLQFLGRQSLVQHGRNLLRWGALITVCFPGIWGVTLALWDTVESQCNKPLYNEDLETMNDFLHPSNSKIYEKEPQCSKQLLPVPWPFVILRFHCLYYYIRNLCNLICLEQWHFSLIWNTYMWKLQTFCWQWYKQY